MVKGIDKLLHLDDIFQMDEKEAVARIRRRDIGGLEALVYQYQLQAVRTADIIVRDQEMAKDIVQTAFLRSYERIDQLNEGKPYGPWFFRIVVNDALKAVSRRKHVLPIDSPLLEEWQASFLRNNETEPGLEEQVETEETRQAIWEALSNLDAAQRAVIVLHYYLGLSVEEMCAELSSPIGTVKWRLYAARKRLKTLLKSVRDTVGPLKT